MRQHFGLALMVKNEAKVIERCINSVLPGVDVVLVCDTGSTDGTIGVVTKSCKDKEVAFVTFAHTWVNYAYNRNFLLEKCREFGEGIDYWLLLDADETIEITHELPELTGDAIQVMMENGSLKYSVPRLVSAKKPWKYVGAAHEYITCDEPFTYQWMSHLVIHHHADGGNHGDKLEREAALLLADLHDNPKEPRTVFYLARTFDDMGRWQDACKLYEQRKGLGGFDEEIWYSWYRKGALLCEASRKDPITAESLRDEGIAQLLDAYQVRPWRAEPLWYLANFYSGERSHTLAQFFYRAANDIPYPHNDQLFIDQRAYRRVYPCA
jgi:glycosyltransferase involved in cell wall biosynthesis